MQKRFSFVVAIVILLLATFTQAQQLAFPEAEGYGRFARGGRGGKILFVTNLNDNGPGSLRAAIETQGPRIVVFNISGTIQLQSNLRIVNPRITIAGQTAPGDGICLRKYPLIISAADSVVRYIRVRLGDEGDKKVDGIDVSDAENVIVDHCSVSWTLDEAVNTYHGTKNVTIQWCLISESLHNSRLQQGHGFAASLGGINTSYHHNLLANNAGRNPSIAGEMSNPTINLDFRNNVVFNWQYRTLDGRPRSINVVNNYYKAGPASNEGLKIVKIQCLENGSFGRWHVKGNLFENRSKSLRRNDLVRIDSSTVPLESAMIDEPVDFAPIVTETPEEAFEKVLLNAGAIRPIRDSHDERIVREVRTGKTTFGNGIIASQTQVGGWPKLASARPQQDTDADGMPDEWERRFSPTKDLSLQSSADLDEDGYTNVEEYLNQTDPTKTDSASTAPAIAPQQELTTDTSYTIENCISEFSPEDVTATEKGWKYWHVPRDLSPTFNFKISHVGPSSANHKPHTHPEEEIFYIIEGTTEFSLNGKTRTVGPKSTMFCPSGIPHGIRNVGDKPLTYAVIKANYPGHN